MLNLARIPGWTWIFVIIALIMGSALIVGAAIERRRNRSIKMVRRSSAYKRRLFFNRALVAGLVMSLLVALVGCASGGGVTVEDSESSGFLPSTAEPTLRKQRNQKELNLPQRKLIKRAFEGVHDFRLHYWCRFRERCTKEAFGDRKPAWANTSFYNEIANSV